MMQTRVLSLLAAVGLAACPALAIPPALDLVPAGTPVVIGVRDATHLTGSIKKWAGLFVPEEEMGAFAMAEGLLQTPGLDASGSAAVVMNFVPGQEEPQPILVLPVSDYEAFIEAMQGEAGDEVTTLQVMGEEAYAKKINDSFIAVGPDFDSISGFTGEAGQTEAHVERLGAIASAAADDADMFFIVDVQSMRPFLEMGIQQMQQGMAMAAMMGGEAVQAQMEAMTAAAQAVVNDGRTAFIGLTSGDAGIAMDLAAQFDPESATGEVFADGGNAGALVEELPSIDYVFAYAIDTSSQGVRNLIAEAAKMSEGMSFAASMGELAELQTGQSMVMGVTPGLLAGGLFANTVQYTRSEQPQELLEAFQQAMTDMNGQTQQGMKFTTTFQRDAAKAGDTPLHAYGVTFEVDPNDENAMMASMALQQMTMMFGGEAGPKGYLAIAEDGLYQTMTRNTALITKAIEADESLTENAGISAITDNLPEDRTAVAYINVKGLIDMIAPMAAMMGAPVSFDDIPEDLKPIGMSLTTGEAGMRGRLFMPADVLETISSFAEQMQEQGDEWEEVEEEPDAAPRF